MPKKKQRVARKRPAKPKATPKTCTLIQWAKLCTLDGKPVCPQCHAPAEMIIGIFGEPDWAHVPAKREP